MRHAPGRIGSRSAGKKDHGRRWPVAVVVFAAAGAIATAAAPAGAAAVPATATARVAPVNSFAQTNLIASEASLGARLVDTRLTSAWGLAAGPTTPIWVSDGGSGHASVYTGGIKGSAVQLQLSVPVPGGSPTGQVFAPDSAGFEIGHLKTASDKIDPVGDKQYPADFILDTDSSGSKASGEIQAWDGGSEFVVEDSPAGGLGGTTPVGAVFEGLAIATTPKAGPELFAADVHNATIDVFNTKFALVKTPQEFRDPKIPAGYTPFGIQTLDRRVYVTYARQNKSRTGVVAGSGLGFVDVYNVDGQLVRHLVAGGPLNAPWGLALAPVSFGPFGGDLLVGNAGDGRVNAFNPATGKYLGPLDTTTGHPIAIPGLRGLQFGNSEFGGSSSLVFSAGSPASHAGLIGVLRPADNR